MNAPSIRRACALLALSAALALSACGENPLARQEEEPAVCHEPVMVDVPISGNLLFTLLEAPVLTAEQERLLAVARSERAAAKVHVARLSENAMEVLQPDREIRLTVSPTRTFSVFGVSLHNGAQDYVFFTGQISGLDGDVHMVLSSLGVTGTLQAVSTREVYAFRPLGAGLHAITCIDPSKFGLD
jgi:hypothetical protein